MTDTKIGCVQHDCEDCKKRDAEIERLKCHIKHIGNDALRTENRLLQEKCDALTVRLNAVYTQEPVAYLANGTRFKVAVRNGEAMLPYLPDELGGRWVALVAADDDCHLKITAPIAQPADALLKEMRYIAGISTGQVKRVADAALERVAQPAEPSSDDKTWCEYVAGVVGCYLGEPVDSDKYKAIAAIIERRLWALQRPAEPVELTDADVRAVGGIVHRDGNVFFTNVALLNKAIAARGNHDQTTT
jgi:hypothetical protein